MIDISTVGTDVEMVNSQVYRAKNILNTQINTLYYALDLGIDLDYFLSEDFVFQNESFRSYLIQRLASFSINIVDIVSSINNLHEEWDFIISPINNTDALISR